MTKKITDLEGRLDATLSRAGKAAHGKKILAFQKGKTGPDAALSRAVGQHMVDTNGSWYVAKMGNHQGLVIEEGTGRNVAVTYDKKDAPLVAAAPDLLAIVEEIASGPGAEDCYWCSLESWDGPGHTSSCLVSRAREATKGI